MGQYGGIADRIQVKGICIHSDTSEDIIIDSPVWPASLGQIAEGGPWSPGEEAAATIFA